MDSVDVIIIEDDDDDVYLVKEMLSRDEERKYTFTHCSNLQESCSILSQAKPDIVLLDLGLSDSYGLATLTALKEHLRETPVIVLTGINDDKLGQEAIKLGAEDYLPKAEVSTTLLSRAITYAIERHRLVQEVHQKASQDALTGLPNRWALFDRLDVLIDAAERNNAKLAVALMDLDGFKQVNDTLGHRLGDKLLQEVASRLTRDSRRSDMIARYGGDEFVMLLTNYGKKEDLIEVLNKKISAISEPILLKGTDETCKQRVGASIGVVEWTSSVNAQQLINCADRAMYHSKRCGKNRVTYLPDVFSSEEEVI